MSNTLIQIKRSTITTAPAVLAVGEPAYSYLSNKLFIGTSGGDGAIAIGGKYFVDLTNTSFDVANAAFAAANAAGSSFNSNLVFDTANAAFDKANSANVLAYNTGIGANAYASAVGVSANAYAAATFLPLTGGTVSGDLNIAANLTVTGTTTYVNTQSLLVSDNIFVLNADLPNGTSATQDAGMLVNRGSDPNVGVIWNETTERWTISNDGTNYYDIAWLSYVDGTGVSANNYAGVMANSSNGYASSVGVAANAYASAVGTSANAYAAVVGAAANTNAANGSYISTGVVKVPVGGTGLTTFTQNGILFGNTAGDLKVTAAGTEGQILQASSTGVPLFAMLDGGSF